MNVISTQPAPTTNFRNLAAQLAPTYLSGPWGTKWLYTHAIIFDTIAEAASFAAMCGNPSRSPTDGLPWLQLDRQIDPGPHEPEASVRARLAQWLDLWVVAGSQRAILRALGSYFIGFTIVEGASPITIETVNDSTAVAVGVTAWDVGPADPPTHVLADPGNWNWDGAVVPGRSWVIVFNGPWAQSRTWGDGGTWGDGHVWGSNMSVNDASSLRALVAKRKAAGNSVAWIIVAFDPTWFVATLPPGDAKLPDGNWGTWGKIATIAGVRTYVPARTSTAIYINGPT